MTRDELEQLVCRYREALERCIAPLTSDVEAYEIAREALNDGTE